MRVAAAQIEVCELDIAKNTRKILGALEEAARRGADILCFCEGALTGWITNSDDLATLAGAESEISEAISEVAEACKSRSIPAIVGLTKPVDGTFENQAIVINEMGKILHTHAKVCLTDHERDYRPGTGFQAVEVAGTKIGVAICFEFEVSAFGCRKLIDQGARVIFNPKHHRSPPNTWKDDACNEVMRVTCSRAIESQRHVVSVNRAVESEDAQQYREDRSNYQMSHSMIVDPRGFLLGLSYPVNESLLISDIEA